MDSKNIELYTGFPAITIVFPIHKDFKDTALNKIQLKNAVKTLRDQLKERLNEEQMEWWRNRLKENIFKIKVGKETGSLIIYISEDIFEVVRIPIALPYSIEIGERFASGYLAAAQNLKSQYNVIALSKGGTRLFVGDGFGLTEIKNEHFPFPFVNEYEDHKENLKYSKDGSDIEHKRLDAYFRQLDNALEGYIQQPCILLGVDRHIAHFLKVSGLSHQIVESVKGNFDNKNEADIFNMISPIINDKIYSIELVA